MTIQFNAPSQKSRGFFVTVALSVFCILLITGLVACGGGGGGTGAPSLAVPAGLSYSTNPATYIKDVPITANLPTSTGGAIATYSVSPALPTGLSLNTGTGVISGTPTAITAPTNCIVTGTNASGNTTVSLVLRVDPQSPAGLSYPTNPATYYLGASIPPNIPTSTGGAIATYSVSPALPTGLSLDTGTGVLSGTPTAMTAQATYLVTGTNVSGNTAASLVLRVDNPPPAGLSYASNPAIYYQDEAIPANLPTSTGGAIATYSVAPALPTGLSLDTGTGVISGTPTAVTAQATYVVTGTNTSGNTTVPLVLRVNPPTFFTTGSMLAARQSHISVVLPNGKILVAGGQGYLPNQGAVAITSAEIYDPATGTFTATGSMNVARFDFTATLLPGPNGKVLITGGYVSGGTIADTAELYDPATGLFTLTGSMHTTRNRHTATLLANGKVLISGGASRSELYDPSTETFTYVPGTHLYRSGGDAVLLQDGRVFFHGGLGTPSQDFCEIYDPVANTFTQVGKTLQHRLYASVTALGNGKVLIAGGEDRSVSPFGALASAELFDPGTGLFTFTGSMTSARDYGHTATLHANNKVLIVGGVLGSTSLKVADLYDPVTGTFTATASTSRGRSYHRSIRMPNGRVLVTGGSEVGILAVAEVYIP